MGNGNNATAFSDVLLLGAYREVAWQRDRRLRLAL